MGHCFTQLQSAAEPGEAESKWTPIPQEDLFPSITAITTELGRFYPISVAGGGGVVRVILRAATGGDQEVDLQRAATESSDQSGRERIPNIFFLPEIEPATLRLQHL